MLKSLPQAQRLSILGLSQQGPLSDSFIREGLQYVAAVGSYNRMGLLQTQSPPIIEIAFDKASAGNLIGRSFQQAASIAKASCTSGL